MKKLVFLDLETTCSNPDVAEPIQIAMVAVDEGYSIVDEFEMKIVFDTEKASAAALKKNHHDAGVWAREAYEPEVAAQRVNDFFWDHATWEYTSKAGKTNTWCECAGHNIARFDGPVLDRFIRGHGEWPKAALWATATLDTMHLARWVAHITERPFLGFALETLANYLNIGFEGKAHDALADVKMTVEVAKKLEDMLAEAFQGGLITGVGGRLR